MAATDKSRQTSLASTRTPNTDRCPQIHGSFISADCRERFHPKDNFRHLPMTIRLNIPTIQALESHKITTNNPTTTEKDQQQQLQALVSFVNPNIISLQQWNLSVAISPSPDIRDKQSLPLQIPSPVCFFEISQILKHPRNVPQIRNKSSESYNSTSELPNDPKTFLFVSTTSLCRFSALCPLTDLLQPRDHEDHSPTAPSPIPL